jgi:hypothetical protein
MANPLERLVEKLRTDYVEVPLKDVQQSEFTETVEAPSFTVGSGDLTLTAGVNTDVDLLVLNQATDVDSDGVFATTIVGPDGQAVAPFISFDAQRAWLKYKITGTLSGDSTPTKGFLSAAVSASKSIALADYRTHDATSILWSALDDDRKDLRSVLSLSDVKSLKPGEALTLQVDGKLTASVNLSWSDALSTSMSELTDLVAGGVPVAISLSAGLSTGVSLAIEDEFMVVMSRAADSGKLRICVNKTDSRTSGVTVSLVAGAGFDATSAPKEVLDAVLEGILGTSASKVESLLAKLDGTALDPEETKLVELLAKRLNLDTTLAREEALRKKLSTLESEVVAKLNKILKVKAEVGFQYEYQRVDTKTALADYLLDSDDLMDADHGPAIDGDFATLTGRLVGGGGRSVLRFLNQREINRTSAFGFTLGFGSWSVAFQDKASLEWVERENMAGTGRMISVKGARSYDEPRLPDNDFTWVVDLKADMDTYAADPVTSDFDYGLSYLATFKRKKLSAADVARFADFAELWHVVAPDGKTTVQQALEDAIGQEAQIDFQLLFDNDPLLQTIRGIDGMDNAAWSKALASAMPYDSSSPRNDVTTRAAAYDPLWTIWLTRPTLTEEDWRVEIPRHLNGPALDMLKGSSASFLFFVTDGYKQMRRRLTNFAQGLQLLAGLIEAPEDRHKLRTAWSLLQPWWTQRPFIAASGVFLLDRAIAAGVLSQIERTMTVTAGGKTVTVSS